MLENTSRSQWDSVREVLARLGIYCVTSNELALSLRSNGCCDGPEMS